MFRQNIDAAIKGIKTLPSNEQEVFFPGEIQFNLSKKREKEEIFLDDAINEDLNSLADKYNIEKI